MPGEVAAPSVHATPPTVTLAASTSMLPPLLLPMDTVSSVPVCARSGTTAARRGRMATVTAAGNTMGVTTPGAEYDSGSGVASASGTAAAA